jgi:WD40 repeat protein
MWKFEARSEKWALAFSPTSRTLAAVTRDKVILWEVATFRERVALPVKLSGEPSSVVLSPDGTLLAFCDRKAPAGRHVRVWDLAARKELSGVAAGAERVSAIAFSPDGRHLATASEDTTVLIWDLRRHRPR